MHGRDRNPRKPQAVPERYSPGLRRKAAQRHHQDGLDLSWSHAKASSRVLNSGIFWVDRRQREHLRIADSPATIAIGPSGPPPSVSSVAICRTSRSPARVDEREPRQVENQWAASEHRLVSGWLQLVAGREVELAAYGHEHRTAVADRGRLYAEVHQSQSIQILWPEAHGTLNRNRLVLLGQGHRHPSADASVAADYQ
jgi:hypothetical protein